MTIEKRLLPCALALALAACGGDAETTENASGDDATSGSESRTGPTPASVQRNVDLTPATPGSGGACELSQVFFEYDSSDLDASSRDAIDRAVECFRTRGLPARLHLTGATDPRGTEEYNIVLGERRAEAVRRYLVGLGVDAGRIDVHSMGEETAEGTDEDGWARDRNVTAAGED